MGLREIGQNEYTGKVSFGYLEIYERLWRDLQYQPITLLEIGIYNGNSLRVWCKWFPSATIIGIDSNETNPMRTDRAKLHFGKQEDIGFLESLSDIYSGFDIIIDDGGHYWQDQQISFETLWPYLKTGGMYIIEDLHTSADKFWAKGEQNTVDYLKDVVDATVFGRTDVKSIEFYKSLAVIHKKD